MAGIDEVRAGVALANEKVNEALAAVAAAVQAVQDAHSAFATSTQGSGQQAVPQGLGLLNATGQNLDDANGNLNHFAAVADQYVASL